jgi:hypothetical protein
MRNRSKKPSYWCVTPVVITTDSDTDYGNTYSIAGFCGVNQTTYPPPFVNIHDMTISATNFAISLEKGITVAF